VQCQHCKAYLYAEDFDRGRAITLQGRPYCEGCLVQAVKTVRQTAGAPLAATGTDPKREEPGTGFLRRRHIRFAPPLDCGLILEPERGGGPGGNVVKIWVDVSEGGLRVIVEGSYEAGAGFRGVLTHASLGPGIGFRAEIRHAKPSTRLPGCLLAGLQFAPQPPELGEFIRTMLDVPRWAGAGSGDASANRS
jgi:hypothetical protein